ncbi:MAG: PTS sugar transporter subunit IIA [Chloroflexota bacterium]|nr:PTS sugar transporter subunit IIA [Chloroflexota bacterium]MBI5701919.1 PTS sugar transporter subunit IIA [Chloroflexota bacterium]
MSILSIERIQLNAAAVNRTDAIRKAGDLLVKSGCVLTEYIEGMLKREESMSTYLGSGVAIPHGVYENKDHVLQTAISVLQLPQGVEWDEGGEPVYLVIGIAAQGDEHVGVLARLAEAVEDEAILNDLIHTSDPEVILKHLGREPDE